jgi:hypothetical protein
MDWHLSYRADPRAAALADRHYSRRTVGARQFSPPGWLLCLLTRDADALWVTSLQREEFTDHDWPGAWVCTIFRNESDHLSSHLIVQAVAATRSVWQAIPAPGVITFIDPERVRKKRDPGRCFRRAGFVDAGLTKSGLVVLRMPADVLPKPLSPLGQSGTLFESLAVF